MTFPQSPALPAARALTGSPCTKSNTCSRNRAVEVARWVGQDRRLCLPPLRVWPVTAPPSRRKQEPRVARASAEPWPVRNGLLMYMWEGDKKICETLRKSGEWETDVADAIK